MFAFVLALFAYPIEVVNRPFLLHLGSRYRSIRLLDNKAIDTIHPVQELARNIAGRITG